MAAKPKKENPKIYLVSKTEGFFYDQLKCISDAKQIKLSLQIEQYLVELLNRFTRVDNFFTRDEGGKFFRTPITFLWKEAIEESSLETQKLLFRNLGDMALYTSGFFNDYLERKLLSPQYFIQIGSNSYRETARLHYKDSMGNLYQDLAERFPVCVNLLTEVSNQMFAKSEKGLIDLYEKWLRTKDKSAERILKEHGLLTPRNEKN